MIQPEVLETMSIAQQIDPGMQLTQDIIANGGLEAPQDPSFGMTDRFRNGFKNVRYAAMAGLVSVGAMAFAERPDSISANAGGSTAVAAGSTTKIHATDTPGQTIIANLTETNAVAGGFITAFPCAEGLPNPLTSNINFAAGATVANSVTVKADQNGDVCLVPNVATDMIWDQAVETGAIVAHNAVRKLDTRNPVALQGTQLITGSGQYIGIPQTKFDCKQIPDPLYPDKPTQYMTVAMSGLTPDYTPNNYTDANGDTVTGSFLADGGYMPSQLTGHPYIDQNGNVYYKRVDMFGNDLQDIDNWVFALKNRIKGMLTLKRYNSPGGGTSVLLGTSIIYIDEPCA